jgi:hypothetical protein
VLEQLQSGILGFGWRTPDKCIELPQAWKPSFRGALTSSLEDANVCREDCRGHRCKWIDLYSVVHKISRADDLMPSNNVH